MGKYFSFKNNIEELSEKALKMSEPYFKKAAEIARENQEKVLAAFIKYGADETCLGTTTGYGYGDKGREVLDKITAEVFSAEDAIIRCTTLTCGTHTLSVMLFGILRTGDTMLSVSGTPYDTLKSTIGIDGEGCGQGNLKDFGISYEEISLKADDTLDYEEIEKRAAADNVKVVYLQRSRGYSLRHSITISEIERVCEIVHRVNKNAVVAVDNCYGEFVEDKEPTAVGADVCAGSLIKNPGGGITHCGGYIAGRHDLVEKCAYRLTAQGLGREVGATLGTNREMYMGFFKAPSVVCEAVKTAIFTAALFKLMGFAVSPEYDEKRTDIIEALLLKNEKNLIAYCQGLQTGAPIDSFVRPEPWEMPGYNNKVIMSSGAFTAGSSIEISADAPLREPFAVWSQGGIIFDAAKIAVMKAAEKVAEGLKEKE